jgi:two-component system chemotaxis response regulator CheY
MASLTFLIIEDSPTMRQLIRFALNRIPGAEVVEASDGVDGLKKLSSNQVDLILTDINMPIMDGLKLVSLVRSNEAYSDVPIVIITTEGAKEDKERAMLWFHPCAQFL